MAKAHPHAALMGEYVKDALESETPWKNWEYKLKQIHGWHPMTKNPLWDVNCEYRRKIKYIFINGIEVPEPIKKPLERETIYYVPAFDTTEKTSEYPWYDDDMDSFFLKAGLIHLDKESAKIHAEALLSFTQIKE